MDINQFWNIIEKANDSTDDFLAMGEFLKKDLCKYDWHDILHFQLIFDEYYKISDKMHLWAAAYVINGGCSDDGFDYFRAGLIAQGKNIYLLALKNPDALVDTSVDDSAWDFEELLSVAQSAFLEKMGFKSNDYKTFWSELGKAKLSADEKFLILSEVVYSEKIDFDWEEDDLETLVPRLYKKFW